LLALDTRLAGIVRASREPMLAQLRLAWWREQFGAPLELAPRGEPLLAALRGWEAQRSGLIALVDGWEAFAAGEKSEGIAALARARGTAIGALTVLNGVERTANAATRMGEGWALADMAGRLADAVERAAAETLAQAHDWTAARLPRAMRPLAVLHGLAARATRRIEGIDAQSSAALATVLRIGLLGR
jgi:phytoene synthase